MQKNMASKGGPAKKISCVKGGQKARRPKIAFLRF